MHSIKKDVLKNFEKFTGKHLCLGPFFNKDADLRLLQATASVATHLVVRIK